MNKCLLKILGCVIAVGCLTGCGNNQAADSAATSTEAPAKVTQMPAETQKPDATAETQTPAATETPAEKTPMETSSDSPAESETAE